MQLLGLALEDERGQVGVQDKRSAWVSWEKNLEAYFGANRHVTFINIKLHGGEKCVLRPE